MVLKRIIFPCSVIILWLLIAQSCMRFRISDSKAAASFKKVGLQLKTGVFRIGGRDLHYVMTGNDTLPTLMLIHGTPGSWTAFENYLKDSALLRVYKVVSIDRPGFGYSGFGKALNLEEQSSLLVSLADSLHDGLPVFLAGHSLGGPLVVKMAAERPDMFKAIMLISASVDPALEPKEEWRKFMDIIPFRFLLPGAFRPSNRELLYFKTDILTMSKDLSKIRGAVHIIHGAKDSWVPVGNAGFAKKNLTHASAVHELIIPDGNHFIPWTYQKLVVQEMAGMR
jgi:pimeloyl-ACP methyl ester carboxylesterase